MKKELKKRIISSLILLPIALFFIFKGSFFFSFFIFIFFLITLYEWQMMSKNKSYNILGLLFITSSFYTVYLLRNLNEYNDYINSGLHLFLIVTLTCIFTDLGGYIFGKIFKGPKLTKISPNKTFAGMFGGLILSIISINLYLNYFDFNMQFTREIFIFVLTISLISQIGDIIISYFKRKSKIKDTGKIIPGHGGLLDRVDGMIFAFPYSYLVLELNLI